MDRSRALYSAVIFYFTILTLRMYSKNYNNNNKNVWNTRPVYKRSETASKVHMKAVYIIQPFRKLILCLIESISSRCYAVYLRYTQTVTDLRFINTLLDKIHGRVFPFFVSTQCEQDAFFTTVRTLSSRNFIIFIDFICVTK